MLAYIKQLVQSDNREDKDFLLLCRKEGADKGIYKKLTSVVGSTLWKRLKNRNFRVRAQLI